MRIDQGVATDTGVGDLGLTDTGTSADSGIEDSGVADAGPQDGGPDLGMADGGDLGVMDTGVEDAGPDQDTGVDDAGPDLGIDAGPIDQGPFDGGVDLGLPDLGIPDIGLDLGLDVGIPDIGIPDVGIPDVGVGAVLIEDFTNFNNEIFTCPDGTQIQTGALIEQGTQCLGIDGFSCPAPRMLAGPGDAMCVDPLYNPFVGAGQCVSDFFSCFNPTGTCTDNAGTFSWQSGAQQIISFDMNGGLIESRFIPAGATQPCIIGTPETPGATRIRYVRQ